MTQNHKLAWEKAVHMSVLPLSTPTLSEHKHGPTPGTLLGHSSRRSAACRCVSVSTALHISNKCSWMAALTCSSMCWNFPCGTKGEHGHHEPNREQHKAAKNVGISWSLKQNKEELSVFIFFYNGPIWTKWVFNSNSKNSNSIGKNFGARDASKTNAQLTQETENKERNKNAARDATVQMQTFLHLFFGAKPEQKNHKLHQVHSHLFRTAIFVKWTRSDPVRVTCTSDPLDFCLFGFLG